MLPPEGEEIEKDAPLMAFDTSDLQRRHEQKTAERDTAAKQLEMKQAAIKVSQHDAGLELAEAKANRRKAELKADAPADITATIELEKLQLDYQLAKEQVDYLQRKSKSARERDEAEIKRWKSQRDRADARVQQIDDAITKMTVLSPRKGTVIFETDWQGEKKKVGDSAWRGGTILQVVSLDEMQARGEIDEIDASKVVVGQTVSLRLDAQPDVELRGKILEIADNVQRKSPDNPLKVVRLDISLDETGSARLLPGMRFRGRVELERVEDVLLVSIDAIVPTPDGPVAYRRTVTGVEAVPVTLGRRDGERIEVLEGLSEGDELRRADQVEPTEAAG
jgi:multidrug efflux pump subunit AcrA (membrane-fusion protein)